jgi:hypothetical protein
MANEVYLLTHDGLSQVVSARAATRFLDKALESKGLSPDSVTTENMREILQGPILRELRQILPKDGVERSIKQISRNLRKQAEKVAEQMLAANASAPVAVSSSNLPSVSGDVLITGEDEVEAFTSEGVSAEQAYTARQDDTTSQDYNQVLNYDAAEADLGIVSHSVPLGPEAFENSSFDVPAFDTQSFETPTFDTSAGLAGVLPAYPADSRLVASQATESASVSTASQVKADSTAQPVTSQSMTAQPDVKVQAVKVQAAQSEYDPEVLAAMLVKFAQLDNVKVVAAVKPTGDISMSRGSGFDVDALSRLGSLGIKLLSRGRTIRSYYLSQSRYQLFLFPLYTNTSLSQTLIVVGSSDVNVGDVFSVRSQLQEDL